NLSEQFLVNKVKEDWAESDFTDGYFAERAANLAVDEGQALPNEGGWTYNPSPNRPNVADGTAAAYANSCNPYGTGPNAGTCSDTSHQSRRVCSTFIFTVCGYATVNFGGPGVASSRAYQVWANGQSFDLNRYRLLLSQGYVLMASFPVYKGFMDDVGADGVVSNYARTRLDAAGAEVAGSYGGHAVQIVGFLSNEEMSKPGRTPVNIGGGGYFIIKNSWGCGAGDGGYYYVPADYISGLFNSLSALAFDGNRSAAWTAEQTTPGGGTAPTIEIKASPATVDLRVESDLAFFFKVAHPVAKSVTLKVTSPTLGTLYNDVWSTDPDFLFGSSLKYAFQQVGDFYLTLEARYGTSVRTATLLVRVVNSPPTLAIQANGVAYQDEPFALSANVGDKNQTDVGALCANTTWSVSAPDTLTTTAGCQVEATFGASGDRTVSATVRDAESLTTTRSVTLAVQPPRENPYPVISASGVYSIESLFFDNQFFGCQDVAVGTGATIDLRATGCSIGIGAAPQRYFAGLNVENPSGEALSYDWRLVLSFAVSGTERVLITTTGAAEPDWELYSPGNALLSTDPCRVEVVVHAPDPSRNKGKTVWTGQCTYYATTIN
ncbi:MAG TPA: C1 family peptidase, partial [Trueperaceae bacterium]|nr:C1 family peptidase [Trueperaceae bacterium]